MKVDEIANTWSSTMIKIVGSVPELVQVVDQAYKTRDGHQRCARLGGKYSGDAVTDAHGDGLF